MDERFGRTLRELNAPNFPVENSRIRYPNENVPFVLNDGLKLLLPRFHGFVDEDPFRHLEVFCAICSTMRPQGVLEEHMFLKAFPYSLMGYAKDWLYCLAPNSVTSWNGLERMFLEAFFPRSRTIEIRKAIAGARQFVGESLYAYLERYKELCTSCPHLQISEELLIEYFYEGLSDMDRSLLDEASGGALWYRTPQEAWDLIEIMASDYERFKIGSNEYGIQGIQDMGSPSVLYQGCPSQVPHQQTHEPTLEDLVRQLTMCNLEYQERTKASIQSLCTQVEELATSMDQLQNQSFEELPTQLEENPENASLSNEIYGESIDLPVPEKCDNEDDLANEQEKWLAQEEVESISEFYSSEPFSSAPKEEQQPSLPLPHLQGEDQHMKVEDVPRTPMEIGGNNTSPTYFDAEKHPPEEHPVFHNGLLDDNLSEFYNDINFSSLTDFDDTYTCVACTNSHFCSACAEIEHFMQGGFRTDSKSVDAIVEPTKLEGNDMTLSSIGSGFVVNVQVKGAAPKGFLGHFQSPILYEDPKKTLFCDPFKSRACKRMFFKRCNHRLRCCIEASTDGGATWRNPPLTS